MRKTTNCPFHIHSIFQLTTPKKQQTFTPNFWKLSFSMLFFTTSYNMVIPEMNSFITELGHPTWKGLIIALFTISSAISRPFSGKLADTIGRKKVIRIGILISVVVCFLYSFVFAAWFLLFLRFLHGFSAGFFPTGSTALITDILPENKRGVGMGIWGTFISVGMGLGQGVAVFFTDWGGRDMLFVASSVFGLISYALYIPIQETLKHTIPFNRNLLKIKRHEIIEPAVLPVAIVMLLSTMSSGIVLVLAPDISSFLSISNKGAFFVMYVSSTIFIRLFTGNLSDKYGRRETLLVGLLILIISMLMIGISKNATWFLISATVFGIATGITSPTIFAWTADLSPKQNRGLGSGTMFIALEIGILCGSMITGLWYKNNLDSIWNVFVFGSAMIFIAILYLSWHIYSKKASY